MATKPKSLQECIKKLDEAQGSLDACRHTISDQRSEIASLKQKVNTLESTRKELKETLSEYHTCLCIAEGYIQRTCQSDSGAFEPPRNPHRTQLHVMDDIFGEKPRTWMDL